MGGTGNELTSKFVKAHLVNQAVSNTAGMRWLHKLIYEFWGFCVNGDNDLLTPRGFAPSAGVLMPAGFEKGTATLVASGSDGGTTDGSPFFTSTSVNWQSGSMTNYWLVTWKSGSTSTDDSIYPITQIINSSTIRVDVNTGGTPYTGSLHASFSTRTNVNFRVIDFKAASALAGYTADADGLVLCLSGAYLVNSGQVTPQVRTRIRTTVGANLPNVGLTLSSSGSWTAASGSGFFTDGTAEISANTNGGGWLNSSTGPYYITLIGAQDFLVCHYKGLGASSNTASGFHIEVPQRLYAQGFDPNPVVAMNFGVTGLNTTSTTQNYGGGFQAFHPPDGTTRGWQAMARSLSGDYWHNDSNLRYSGNAPAGLTNGRFNEMYFNVFQNKFMMNELALALPGISGQYAAMRLKLRRARFIPNIIPQFQRLGDHGEWLHIQNGILWPWDGSILPYNLLAAGT